MYQAINLTQTVQGCLDNHLPSQEALYKWCYPPMMKVCRQYFDNHQDAAAMFNQSMLKVFRGIASYTDQDKLLAWVKTIVINTCIDKLRTRTQFVLQEITAAEELWVQAGTDTYDQLTAKEIVQLVQELPQHLSVVFKLYVMEGYKHEEIAQLLHIPIGTSKWHLSEARKWLKSKLEKITKKESLVYGK